MLGSSKASECVEEFCALCSDDFLCNRFCTMTETININQQPKVTESPELPDWVRIVKEEEAAVELEDGFLLPSSRNGLKMRSFVLEKWI